MQQLSFGFWIHRIDLNGTKYNENQILIKETKQFLFSFCFGPKTMTTTIWVTMLKQKLLGSLCKNTKVHYFM